MEVELIDIGKIVEDPDQPRKHHDEENLKGLADSIRQHGVLQPITVTFLSNVNMYRIVTGERRWRASQMAGLDAIPCIVRDMDRDDVLTQQLIENLQREDLQPLEKAHAINHIKSNTNSTNREMAGRLGISERSVGYLLDLMELPQEIGEKIVSSPNKPADGQLTEKHARFLKQLKDQPDLQSAVAEKIQSEKINSDQTGKLVKALKKHPDKSDEILSSPTDHLVQFFRDIEPPPFDEDEVKNAAISPTARRIVDLIPQFEEINPTELQKQEVRQLMDSLTSLKLAVDGLLRECKLELGEPV